MRAPLRALSAAAVAAGLWAGPAAAQVYTRVNSRGVLEATNVPDETGFRLTYPGKGTLIHSRGFRFGYNGTFDGHIADAARAFGVPVDLVRAIIQVESEYDSQAVSSKGAQGLMQLMPATAARFGVDDAFDPRQNVFGGVEYLRFLLDLFGGDVSLAAAGYNAGENAVLRYKGVPPYKETRGYVQKVQAVLGGRVPPVSYARRSVTSEPPSSAPAVAFAPAQRGGAGGGGRLSITPAARPAPLVPAPPRTYYRWVDATGRLHVASQPPDEDGQAYTAIRALD